jgi:DNA-binding NarL/FixJ family response regulator
VHPINSGLDPPDKKEAAMSKGLDVIIVDDDPLVVEVTAHIVNHFYTWGEVFVFSDVEDALEYCLLRESGIAVFIVDVFMGEKTGYMFVDSLSSKYPNIYSDTIMITGDASDEVVNACVASGINHLIEKPVRPYALQLAVRSIVSRYVSFSRHLVNNPDFAELVLALDSEAQ